MTSIPVRRLSEVGMADVGEVGGKAAGLGELIAVGARVPDGVVLTAAGAGMTADEREPLLRAAAAELGAGPFAVRSSGVAEDGATASFAGMYESVLNVSADELGAAGFQRGFVEVCAAVGFGDPGAFGARWFEQGLAGRRVA